MFCNPATSQFLIAAIFFVIDCKAGAETCTNCLNCPALTMFELNWYILCVYMATKPASKLSRGPLVETPGELACRLMASSPTG